MPSQWDNLIAHSGNLLNNTLHWLISFHCFICSASYSAGHCESLSIYSFTEGLVAVAAGSAVSRWPSVVNPFRKCLSYRELPCSRTHLAGEAYIQRLIDAGLWRLRAILAKVRTTWRVTLAWELSAELAQVVAEPHCVSLPPDHSCFLSACMLICSLCHPMDCNPLGSSVHGILQARILEWVAMPSSRGSSRPRGQTCISWGSCIAGRFFTAEPPGKPPCFPTPPLYIGVDSKGIL